MREQGPMERDLLNILPVLQALSRISRLDCDADTIRTMRRYVEAAGICTRKVPVPGERFELPTNGLQNRCSTTELTRLAARGGPLSIAAGVSEIQISYRIAIASQTGAPRGAAQDALLGPSGTVAAPRRRARRVYAQTP